MPFRRKGSISTLSGLAAAFLFVAPAQACMTEPLPIYYHSGSARLSGQDRGLLEAMKFMAGTDDFIRLSGHADTAGPAEENRRLTGRRVQGARDYLVSIGMPAGRIITQSFGESHSGTALEDGSPSWRHRYVLIEIVSAAEARRGKAGSPRTTCGG
jgi:hypothetical protein